MIEKIAMRKRPFVRCATLHRSLGTGWLLWIGMGIYATATADDRRDSAEVLAVVRPLTVATRGSVAQVMRDSRVVSLATVVDADGFLVTKRSELSGDPIRVRLSDHRIYPARVAAVRRANDLALLQVDAPVKLTPIEFEPFMPSLGSFVITPGRTGRPIGLGVLGAPGRRVFPRGGLGVYLEEGEGPARVSNVVSGSGAEAAGLEAGDVIIQIDETQLPNSREVRSTLKRMYPGEEVRLTVVRADERSDADSMGRANASGGENLSSRGSSISGRRLEVQAQIRDLTMMSESENDALVNGPRNNRMTGFERVFQHDSVLEPDEVGGPVIDSRGRAIGLNIARAGRVMTYALPASLVMGEVRSMLQEAKR